MHWVSHHWLRVAPGVANFLALSMSAGAWAEQVLQGLCSVGSTQQVKLCVTQAGSILPVTRFVYSNDDSLIHQVLINFWHCAKHLPGIISWVL